MAKVKVVNNKLNQDLIGQNFTNQASNTVFSFGDFSVTSNFTGRKYTDYSNKLKSFGNSYTLENLNVNSGDTALITGITENIVLNLDLSDLKSYVRFGSCSELIRVSLNNIILSYPNSVFVDSKIDTGGNITFFDYSYDVVTNTSIFYVPSEYIVNLFGFVLDDGNTSLPLDNELKNLNLSFDKYCIWSQYVNTDNFFNIIEYNGDTSNQSYIRLKCNGNPFNISGITTTGSIDFHIRPISEVYNKEIKKLKELEKYFLKSRKSDYSGFAFKLKKIVITDDGDVAYNDSLYVWPTTDGFNLDISGSLYKQFITQVITIGDDYDQIKTDLISRMLTTTSLKLSDQTEEKFKKLSRIYGREFDEIKNFIDSIVYINRVSYDKVKNTPDLLIKNLARTLGWNTFTIANSDDLISSIVNLNIDDNDNNPIPAEIDIELWRRIIINSNYYWKSKGTRDAIISILSLVGVPPQFINLNEYIYTVDDKIDINSVELTLNDLPSSTLPYNSDGYPISPIENNSFFFQISGNTDGGKAYMDNFRNVGFKLNETIDNKKAWPYDGYVQRIDDLNPTYTQNDSKLVLNTKVIDIGLDPSSALEYDVFEYIKNVNYPNSSANFAIDTTFVNLNIEYSGTTNILTLPNTPIGNIDLTFNGVTLLPRISGSNTYDYEVSGTSIIFKSGQFAVKDNNDVITISYLFDENGVLTSSDLTYVVVSATITNSGTTIILPSQPSGDVQLSVNGVILTENNSNVIGDFQQNPSNPLELIILNTTLSQILNTNPIVLLTYIHNITNVSVIKNNEYYQVNSFNSNKFYYNSSLHKYVYKTDNRIAALKNVKVSINGIVLNPFLDYNLVTTNGYEISFNNSLNLGDIIGVFYTIKTQDGSEAIIKDYFGIGDISKLSFIEFMTLIQKRMINVKNRQTITNNIGGFYPSLLKVYIDYLFSSGSTTNGYSYQLLLEFATKYGRIFDRFIEVLIPATTIIRNNSSSGGSSESGGNGGSSSGGITIRNLKFNRQKHKFLRGVNYETNYNGDDGSLFKILQTGITYLCILSATTFINEYWVSTGITCNLDFDLISPDFGEILVSNIGLSSPTASYSGVSINLLNDSDILLNEYPYTGIDLLITGLTTDNYKVKIIDGTSTDVCELTQNISITGESVCNLSFNLTSPTYNMLTINNIVISNNSGDFNSVNIGIYNSGNTLITTIPYTGQSTISYSGLTGGIYKVKIIDGTSTENCIVEHTIEVFNDIGVPCALDFRVSLINNSTIPCNANFSGNWSQ